MKNTFVITAVVAVAVGSGAFFGGMKYQASKSPQFNAAALRNLTPEQRQQRFRDLGGAPDGARVFAGRAGGGAAGEIIAKDETSITVKLRDGGTVIVFYGGATSVGKVVDGNSTDLEVGKTVVVTGRAGQDGSITADSIQLRPLPQNATSTPPVR
ncbi:MAG: hypothetical protein G01um101431_238 [Parcubacteria group bacterium Gr01-1014_31]|nr:MAG: hypothetical protein G01um101431_238 [Parcubacteria group bacterium Gr01-1014_31]